MKGIISILFRWIDFCIYLYIHIKATVNAVAFVAKKNQQPTSAHELILKHKRQHRPSKRILVDSAFKKLPNEILIMIFQHLKPNDLYHCSSVSKHWNTLSTPILWKSPIPNHPILSCLASFRTIDQKHRMSHIHQQSHLYPGFPIHLSHYGHAVKSLDLSLIATHVTDCTIRHIVRSCPHLTSLNLSNCRLITNESLRYLSQNHQLQALVLQNCRQITDTGLNYLKCHPFTTLHLGGCHRMTDDGIISLVTASGTTLRRLCLSDCSHVTGKSLRAVSRACGPRLEWLDIARTKAIRHADLLDLVAHCSNITRLNIAMKKPRLLHELRRHDALHQRASLNELIELLDQFNIQPNLTAESAQHRLLLSQHIHRDPVQPHTIESLVGLKQLENLNLSYWTCLTDKAVQTLAMQSHCLTYLNLIGCKGVTKQGLKYLSDLCERKSTCITLSSGLMITPNNVVCSYESNPFFISSPLSSSSSSSSEECHTITKRSKRRLQKLDKTTIVKA
ncbi:uncharacterized protein B0P05DRAFT_533217 [Gilbertella persicaria]|uniref:uncharacterized protein n=1 Tax=Gilbertella persicaria TaxID=101096 RepID=UPI00221E938D|nr:uncharacterized protein B0P05DRAFT_533217 [Gilbertella persicaria]KAI8086990.1 hypothetical protein B0P05DRAFT_533217 [Gilbertella persicaria]